MSRPRTQAAPDAATLPPSPNAGPLPDTRPYVAIGAVLLLGLATAAVQHAERLNSDGIAYIRLAEYWARGDWQLAVSGYWGPLISWLIAAILQCGASPMTAARVAMAASGLVFWIAATALIAATGAGPRTRITGSALCAIAAVCWSVDQISPDLLLAGLICLAIRAQLAMDSATPGARGVATGVWWGLAYLTKAVALPVGIATLLLSGALRSLVAASARRRIVLQSAAAAATFLLLALPWILILSARYDRLTFSTSARIAHAVVGPDDQPRSHPFGRTFHHPAPGRLTTWEDPSRDAYAYWSPWENRTYLRHQLRLITDNLRTLAGLIGHFDALYLTVLSALVLGAGARRKDPQAATLALGVGLPLALLVGAYAPVYVKAVDERYLYALLPLGFASAAGAQRAAARCGWLPPPLQPETASGIAVLAFSFLLAVLPRLPAALTANTDLASRVAADLAPRLQSAHVSGPLAGSALIQGQRTGLFVAFHLGTPWLGDRPDADADAVANSGARAYLVHRGSVTSARLEADPRFRSLDPQLFRPGEDPTAYPLEVFAVESVSGSPSMPRPATKALIDRP